jgi:hypothetical protein
MKQQKKSDNSASVEIVEYNPEHDNSALDEGIDEDSDLEELVFQKSKKKILQEKSFNSPQGGGSKTRKTWLARFRDD